MDEIRGSHSVYPSPTPASQGWGTRASATQFVDEAIKRNVLIIPGEVFSKRDTHFRISYAASNEKIKRGCAILRELAL